VLGAPGAGPARRHAAVTVPPHTAGMTTPTALLTIRAWREDGSEHPLRAEIRLTNDVASGFQRALTLADTARVLEAVRGFLDDLLSSPGP
jgi:hypothetical protein